MGVGGPSPAGTMLPKRVCSLFKKKKLKILFPPIPSAFSRGSRELRATRIPARVFRTACGKLPRPSPRPPPHSLLQALRALSPGVPSPCGSNTRIPRARTQPGRLATRGAPCAGRRGAPAPPPPRAAPFGYLVRRPGTEDGKEPRRSGLWGAPPRGQGALERWLPLSLEGRPSHQLLP